VKNIAAETLKDSARRDTAAYASSNSPIVAGAQFTR
jgi:hypothetical protein